MPARQRGVAKSCPQPVRSLISVLFPTNMIESRNCKRIDWCGRKQRIAAHPDGNNPHPPIPTARNGSGKQTHIPRATIAHKAQENMVGQCRADQFLITPFTLVEIQPQESSALPDRRLRIRLQLAILLAHLFCGTELNRRYLTKGLAVRRTRHWWLGIGHLPHLVLSRGETRT